MPPVLLAARADAGHAATLASYRDAGGYRALDTALRQRTPEELIQQVKDSGLRGRGGAGFPSGAKWGFMLAPEGRDGGGRYLVCNADEMEPGTFKDRVILEQNPHVLIEGMAIASYAMSMTDAFIFVRREYFEQTRRLEAALAEARDAKLLGANILGTEFSLDIHVHRSGGRYICGEETALLNAFEGRRANPRAKPPYPAVSGLWGRPTTVHNVETLACVPGVVEHGAAWFKGLAKNPEGAGTKLYGGSGAVEHPQLIERPIGTTLRELLGEMGGVKGGRKLLGVIPGGASTAFITPEHLDTPMDFDPLVKVGTRLGTGTFIVLSENDCPVKATLNLQRFFARESCGFCTPCRDGLPYGVDLLARLERGEAQREDLDRIDHLFQIIGPNSFCALAAGAAEPVKGLYAHFRDILEAHVTGRGCPFGREPAELAHA
ncbi:MAG TPA: NADH-quinone oxidoreductase subunit NuoF [Candidatus Eisenbacteria bacterium]|nr:NADH-quinone oxidoreductase subunit NuoF [Candidatus Eisenbacteria bacterium]